MYSGTVIDGPYRGHAWESYDHFVRKMLPINSLSWNLQRVSPTIEYVDYVWSHSLGQWCLRY